jgi:3(or 17)beta-hydroxysteroid dehydrogenase
MAGRVQGKVAIVTGGGSGLGRADALALAREGARVVVTDINEVGGKETAEAIGPAALFLRHDVRDEADWQRVIAETVRAFGRLDVLVNNAGLVVFKHVEECTLEDFRRLNAVMSEGTFLGCKHAIGAMRASGGGSIINVSSVAALKGLAPIVAYTAAKGAIRSMTRSVAVHCQDRGDKIRCNVILPGAHDTPMTQQAFAELPRSEAGLAQTNARGQGAPADVANLVLFLASDESRQITGAEFVIDNGETAR